MNVVIGVRELRMSHVRAQIRKHGIQILTLTHPMIQTVGCKSVAKIIKAWGTTPSSVNIGFP